MPASNAYFTTSKAYRQAHHDRSGCRSRKRTVNGTTYTATNYGINWISGLLAVAAIVLMYLPQSNIYFKAAKAHRKGGVR